VRPVATAGGYVAADDRLKDPRRTQFYEAVMIERRSFEEALAEFDDIMRRYRRGATTPSAPDGLTRDEAIARLMKLRFTAGEALRLLRPYNVS
jgi:hypothetical protein